MAILSERDERHQLCLRTLEGLPATPLSCWPVITEAAWLLRRNPRAVSLLLRRVSEGILELLALEPADAAAIAKILEKYSDLRPQLADGTRPANPSSGVES